MNEGRALLLALLLIIVLEFIIQVLQFLKNIGVL
jgi:hypothetical protein